MCHHAAGERSKTLRQEVRHAYAPVRAALCRAQAAHSDRDVALRKHGSGVSPFVVSQSARLKRQKVSEADGEKGAKRYVCFYLPQLWNPILHSFAVLIVSAADEVVHPPHWRWLCGWYLTQWKDTQIHNPLSCLFSSRHTSLCLSISPLFQEPFSHLSTILTQIGGSNHTKIPRKKCWKTLTSSARAGKGGVKGVGVWRERYNPICYHLDAPPLPALLPLLFWRIFFFSTTMRL